MEEINAWRAYESGTTRTARRLDYGARPRRQSISSIYPQKQYQATIPSVQGFEELQQFKAKSYHNLSGIERTVHKEQSSHALFFGTDDIASLRKKDHTPQENLEPVFADASETDEWKEISTLARNVFRVYFTNNDDEEDIAQIKSTYKKNTGMLNKMNGTMPWFHSTVKGFKVHNVVKTPVLFIEACLRGMAQVYFQNNPLTGLLILIAMFVQSSRVAVHGIIAIICGNLSGRLMGFDKSFLSCGLFGYNSFLVGLAIATFDDSAVHQEYTWSTVIGVIWASYFSTVWFIMLGKLLAPYKTPPFTLPFNISTLVFLMAMKQIATSQEDQENLVAATATPLTVEAFFLGSIRGVGQVFLANNIISAVLILAGIMTCSRISAIAAFIGSLLGTGIAALVGEDTTAIENGLYGFNSSLTLTAMVMFYVPSFGSVSVGMIASAITVFVQLALQETMQVYGLPSMTLPFCIAALVFIVIQGTTSSVISVPLAAMTTPEDHLQRVRKLSAGFDLLFGAIRSTAYQGSLRKSWTSVFNYNRRGIKKMSSVLEEYDEEMHGQDLQGGWLRHFNCCHRFLTDIQSNTSEKTRLSSIRQIFGVSVLLKQNVVDNEKETYHRMFRFIDKNDEHKISEESLKSFFKSVGFVDERGLDFALKAFQLMDLDGSGDIDADEFIAFAKISGLLPSIRYLIVKFFDFVDVNGDRAVEMDELDSAREYLGLPPISESDRDRLLGLGNGDEELEFDVIVNFVTIFKLKAIVKEYQMNKGRGVSLDESLRNSITPDLRHG